MCEVSERIMERGRKIGEEQGRKIGEEYGRKIGEERKARFTTLNLSQMGLTPEQIAGAVGESLEQCEELAGGWRSRRTDKRADLGCRSLYLFMRYSDLFFWHFFPACAIICKSIMFPACLILTQRQLHLFFYYIQENLNAFNSIISREIGGLRF